MTTYARIITLTPQVYGILKRNKIRRRIEGWPLKCSRFRCRKPLKVGEKVVRQANKGFVKYYHPECWEAMRA